MASSIVTAYNEVVKYVPEQIYDYLPESILRRSLLIGAVTGTIAYLIFKKRYRLPPGPFSWPIVGNTELFSKGTLGQKFLDLSRKYGPVFTIYMGTLRCIVVNRIDVINEILLTKGAHFSDRLIIYSTKQLLRETGEDIIFGNYNTAWKSRRKVASRAMRLFVVSGCINQHIETAVSKTVSAMLKEEGPFDPKPYMFFTTLNILGAMVFGNEYEYDNKDYLHLLSVLEDIGRLQAGGFFIENVFPPARLFPSKRFKEFVGVTNQFTSYIKDEVAKTEKKFTLGKITNFTESILQAEKEIKEEENMKEVPRIYTTPIVFDIFLAGNETSRQTLYWALMYIAGLPEVQDKIQQEVDSVVGKDRYPTTADRDQLSYTDAVLHEVMRIGSVAPVGVPHMTSCDTTICNGKYEIPKGTAIFINHWGIQNNPDNWEDVDKFKPERFLDEDGKMAPKPENWLPFSAGRRVCLGEPMAKPELHLILASICQRLKIRMEPGVPVNLKPKELGLVLVPTPYKIVVEKRI